MAIVVPCHWISARRYRYARRLCSIKSECRNHQFGFLDIINPSPAPLPILMTDERREMRDLLREVRLTLRDTQLENRDAQRENRESQRESREALNKIETRLTKLDANMNKIMVRLELVEQWSIQKWLLGVLNSIYAKPK